MGTVSGEITLYDLIAWEPRIHSIAPKPDSPQFRRLTEIDVDWILSARGTQPMLPTIRGGELIVLTDRMIREIGVPFAALMREISNQPIAGILTDHLGAPDASSNIVVLHTPIVDSETERDLNRLITNGRRDALQRVAELDQVIAEAGGRGSRPSELIDRLSRLIGIPITVQTPGATTLFTTGSSRDVPVADSDAWLKASLRSGYTLLLGPIAPARHALARFSLNHVRDALQRALDSTLTTTPRGNERISALNALLRQPTTANPDELAQKAMLAGIPPDRTLRVAISEESVPEVDVRRALQSLGDILDAGEIDGNRLWLLASRASFGSHGRLGSIANGWIAVSASLDRPGTLPTATRQASYISKLLSQQLIHRSTAAYDDSAALGLFGLLYAEWGSESQIAYRNQHLGSLIENDPRGMLVDTLGVFLDQGGSQRLAAEALQIHRNTLSYRLRQINAALPVDLDDPHTRLTLHVAIAIHRIITL